ncbi:helix-turn-helix domain-containing protein [Glaciecola siphonariae]|uniref:Helix-turn-helix domain-containing protein n=1 Tax=Glaciecola siphonariae TaxID=521012 RepID=A0ABV9LXB8_9ALTE
MRTFSSGEVAKICDVTSRTVIRWIGAGKLNAFKLPGRGNNRISESDLLLFLNQNKIPVPAEIAPAQEHLCVIVTEDQYLLKHVKRMVRDANFNTSWFTSGIEAGFEIALSKPSLIVLDADVASAAPANISQHIEKLMDYTPHFIVFNGDEKGDQKGEQKHSNAKNKAKAVGSNTTMLSKPFALNDFAKALERSQVNAQ